jgi:BT1 family
MSFSLFIPSYSWAEAPPDARGRGLQGVEATLYAALMSISNAGTGAGDLTGAALTRAFGITGQSFTNLPWLVFTAAIVGLVQLPFILLVPRSASATG